MKTTRSRYRAIIRKLLIGYGAKGLAAMVVILLLVAVGSSVLANVVYGVLMTQYAITSSDVQHIERVRPYLIATLIAASLALRAWKSAEGLSYGMVEFGLGVAVTWVTFAAKTGHGTAPLTDRAPFVIGSLFLIKRGVDTMSDALIDYTKRFNQK